jgi:hypothetical protein
LAVVEVGGREERTVTAGDRSRWHPVGALPTAVRSDDAVSVVDRVAGSRGRRFRSDRGGRAVVVPIDAVRSAEGSQVALVGSPAQGDELAVLDPATTADAGELLASLGEQATHLGVALPPDTRSEEFTPAGWQVQVIPNDGSVVAYDVFRHVSSRETIHEQLGDAPRPAEADDVLDRRAAWFRAREGDTG